MSLIECQLIAAIFREAGYPSVEFNRDIGNLLAKKKVLAGESESPSGNHLSFSYFQEAKDLWLFADLSPGYSLKSDGTIDRCAHFQSLFFRISLFDNNSVEVLTEVLKRFDRTKFNVMHPSKDGFDKFTWVDPSMLPT